MNWLLLKLNTFASITYWYAKQTLVAMTGRRIKPSGTTHKKAAKEKLIKTSNFST